MTKLKKILIVSFFSPPSNAIGAVRITKIAKYLIKFGWDVTIVTVKEKYYDSIDLGTLKEIENARIIRTKIIKPVRFLNEWGIYWLPYLKKTLDELLKKEKFDISLWTGNPFYQWILAPNYKKKYNLKYVLDFRDEWSLSSLVKKWHGNVFYRFKRHLDSLLSKFLEPYVIKNADAIINVTDEVTDLYKNYYRNKIKENKFFTIYNGFDTDYIKFGFDTNLSKEKTLFEIIFPGRFGKFLYPDNFLKALKLLIDEKKLTTKDISVTLVGSEKEVMDKIRALNLDNYVNFIEKKPYIEVLKLIQRADIGLLILHNKIDTSTKIFDYIAMKKKILCVTDVMDARGAKICKEYNNSIVVMNEIEKIKKALDEALTTRENLPINHKVLEFYNREFQTKQLEYILNSIIEGSL